MSRNSFFKTIIGFASVPVIVGAIALTIQKPANALTNSIPPAHPTTQTLETEFPNASTELLSRYATYTFQLTNSQSRSIHYFYASPSNVDSWEEDILGSDVLSAYSSMQVSIDDNRANCYYDFKAVFSDGAETTHYGIDVCDLSRYTF